MADIQRIRTQFLADYDDGPIQFKAGDIFALAESYARSLPPERVKLLGTPTGSELPWGGAVTADSIADTLEAAPTTDPASLTRIQASVSEGVDALTTKIGSSSAAQKGALLTAQGFSADWKSAISGGAATGDLVLKMTAGAANTVVLDVGRAGATTSGRIVYDSGNNWEYYAGGVPRFRIDSGGNLKPSSDNAFACGTASLRWNAVYAATGTIQTSDARYKTCISDIPNEWLDAWASVPTRRFKYVDAVAEKGDSARWHIGYIAQEIISAFESRGLDAFEIGLICHESWPDEYRDIFSTDTDGDENEVAVVSGRELVKAAGEIYLVRYDEAHAMTLALLMRSAK